ncbi:ribosomal protein L4 [Neoconidiobolus thromboides FSU 785]|nr:ribosomal protein L4 [Neoconidiobolus thromboides FSU 785]
MAFTSIIRNANQLVSKNLFTKSLSTTSLNWSSLDASKVTESKIEVLQPLKPKVLRPFSQPKFVAPVAESTQAKVLNPFPTTVQAWLKDFKTQQPIDILNISADVFASPIRRDILQRAVVYERDCLRQGTHSALSRSEVSGTGRKAYAQKGRGKARVGSLRAPHFRGGGRAFPVKPRDHSTKLPRKLYNFALRVLLSTKYAQNQLLLVDNVELDSHKTKDLVSVLKGHNLDSAMFMLGQENDYLELAVNNIPGISVGDIYDPTIYQMMLHSNLVLDKLALAYFEDTLRVD